MDAMDLPRVLTVGEWGYDALRALEREGELQRIRRGAYRRPSLESDKWKARREAHLARCVAISKRLTTPFAFSHATAAVLHGWPAPADPRTVEITQAVHPNRYGHSDIRRHQRRAFGNDDVVEILGLPVMNPKQTVIDCARAFTPRQALETIDKALRIMADVDKFERESSLIRQELLREELFELLAASGPSRNVVRARAVLEYANGLSESPRESSLRWLALAVGLPEPICQWELHIDGRQYFSDLAWLANNPDWRSRATAFEYDGLEKYGRDRDSILRAVADEKAREDTITSTGVAVHRVTRERLKNTTQAAAWLLAKFPPSVLTDLTPRPALSGPLRRR